MSESMMRAPFVANAFKSSILDPCDAEAEAAGAGEAAAFGAAVVAVDGAEEVGGWPEAELLSLQAASASVAMAVAKSDARCLMVKLLK
ncbi:hypothetical protein [Dyella sp. OK004]|uniref:hypothetical protein n=1 Tax=Dyella sp. OK004 TaxID=1855292 RepID=UPI0015A59DA0|nr:hypothetical protein [Dyella sp. OK004]